VHELNYYSKARFRILERRIGFFAPSIPKFISKPIEWIINLAPRYYERFWAYLLPANNLYFELEVIK
jgi:hypothetical protein